jgi:hypothetical protein
MRRTLFGIVSTVLLMLFVAPANAASDNHAGPGFVALDALELTTVTGGVCSSCSSDDEDDEPYVESSEWLVIRQVDSSAEQLSYSIVDEFSNVYGNETYTATQTYSNECRHVFLSGGVGISNGFNVTIGTTYHCARQIKLEIPIQPGYRAKVYKGNMRNFSTITVELVEYWSDGKRDRTGITDTGRRENRWARYSVVQTKGY